MKPDSRAPEHLPPGLTATVGVVAEVLGDVVAGMEGEALFEVVEGVRQEMVTFREARDEAMREAPLNRAAAALEELSLGEKTALARAYTLYLQLVNVCENAYRTHRLLRRGRRNPETPARITFVLTAHPTESHSPTNIRILRRVQDHLVDALEAGRSLDRAEVGNLLRLAWEVGTHPAQKPSVEDEANHLFSLLTNPILTELIALWAEGHRVLFRTWVGGDKDGHPGVGPEQTAAALALARRRLLGFVEETILPPLRSDVALVDSGPVEEALSALEETLGTLASVKAGDGERVQALHLALEAFLFRSYARLLSFTLAKTEPTIWRRYQRTLAPDAPPELVAALDDDLRDARDLALRALGAEEFLPGRPWLRESIRYRAPMIHPLNLLQIELLKKNSWNEGEALLFRETVTGIAAGMLTTG